MENLCQIKGLSCFGCCGNNYKSTKEIKEDIKKNTEEFSKYVSLEDFRDRAKNWDLNKSGVCRNIIEKNGKIFCPLHPSFCGTELRANHCDLNYMCKTFKEFLEWDDKKRKKFISFVKSKKLDRYKYSILMDSDKLLEEFNQATH